MVEKIIDKLKNKNIAILGFGLEGRSTYNFIRKYLNQKLTILDKNKINDNLDNVEIIYGDNYLNDLEKYDLIVKSPGISFKDINTTNIINKITSQLELVLEVNKENIIGITGTKGKSTTSALIYEIIKTQKNNVKLCGNIGIPILDEIESCDKDTIMVIEMSSHQLEFVKHSPHIGIITNLFEDHLDHAGTVEHYHSIKMNMFKYQNENDYMLYQTNNEKLNNLVIKNNYKSKKYGINDIIFKDDNNIYFKNEIVFDLNKKRFLLGEHNIQNIMFALTISHILNLNNNITCDTIYNFKGLEYRLQSIGTYNNIEFYTDTLATIPEATIEAIKTIKDVNTLIFGGMDRGINYDSFIFFLNNCNVENFICMPTTGHKIGKMLSGNVYFVDTLKDAVIKAKNVTKKNTVCLLSPAASSYEYFKNYKEKADKYIEYIKNS